MLWTASTRDAELHLLDATAGNNARTVQVFDPSTGLVQEIRAGTNGHENSQLARFDYTFDTIGNLTSRSDSIADGSGGEYVK